MSNASSAGHRSARPWAAVLVFLLAVGLLPRRAAANDNLYFHGGPMRNYMLDVVFWGNFTVAERSDVRDFIVDYCRYVNGELNPQGLEPAAHYYGLWGLYPGSWLNDPHPIPTNDLWGGSDNLKNDGLAGEIDQAHRGAFGPSFDFWGNVYDRNGLTAGPNRLAIIVTKGTSFFVDTADTPDDVGVGLHDYSYAWNSPWAAVMLEADGGPGTITFGRALSHEVIEAMTDPQPFGGWATNVFPFEHHEACDSCGGDPSLFWRGSSGDVITGITQMTLDPPFPNFPADSCQIWEPEEYAPMAATYEYGGQAGTMLDLVYRMPNGHLGQISWAAGQSASGAADIGQPSATVIAQGKPSIVYTLYGGGEFIFTRGSDSALWVKHNGTWTSLGGIMFGDPSAVVWSYGFNVNVFVLGTDDNLYNFAIVNGAFAGWHAMTGPGFNAFSGPPRAFSRNPTAIDVFAVGEEGHLKQMPYTTATGWTGVIDLGSMLGTPHHTPVGIASWDGNSLDIFPSSDSTTSHRRSPSMGSWPYDYDVMDGVAPTEPSGTPAAVSWGTGRLDLFAVDRHNNLRHVYYSNGWWANPNNPIRTDATGDAVVLSRGYGQLDVLYRTIQGQVTHLNFANGVGWTTEANVLPWGFSVQ
jgi:hypothetical protein